ncbi:hypothetical protein GGQ84_001948 [Desulfitispora alkaliphila]
MEKFSGKPEGFLLFYSTTSRELVLIKEIDNNN